LKLHITCCSQESNELEIISSFT